MINKVFKTILILSLCLGITLPSNAAVSVSDGSAFVTKSEFEADVNNLSNRMAQLENSLDAKIDSLVSAYLTRNGIWNGAKQTLEFDLFSDFWSNATLDSRVHRDFSGYFYLSNTMTIGTKYVCRNKEKTFIQEITKTGMLFGSWETMAGNIFASTTVPGVSCPDTRNYYYFQESRTTKTGGGAAMRNNPNVQNNSECSLWIGSECKFTSVPLDCDILRGYTKWSFLYFCPNTERSNIMFFVSKGDKIDFKYETSLTPQTYDAATEWSDCQAPYHVGTYAGFGMIMGDFAVY